MGHCDRQLSVDAAFDAIEARILPGVSALLEDLCIAAGAARRNGAAGTAQLAELAAELEALARQVEAIEPPAPAAGAEARRISA